MTEHSAAPEGETTAPACGPGLLPDQRFPLVWNASAGDREAFSILLERARPVVYAWALQKTGDPDDAEDISQIVLLRIWSGISSFRGGSKLSSWVYRITANEAVAFHRKKKRRRDLSAGFLYQGGDLGTALPSETERILHVQACGLVRDVACALPPLQLATFRLVDLDGLRPCEAARALGKTQANIRSSLSRARQRVRELVQEARAELAEDLLSAGA